jgi:predicted nucleic-acid-binding protein
MGRRGVRITPDTNILVRALTGDDPVQSPAAEAILARADVVVLSPTVLSELVWVLAGRYQISGAKIAWTIRDLIAADTVRIDRPAIEAGLLQLEAGGDFADGVIAYAGSSADAAFVSFDKQAVALWQGRGHPAQLLA